MEEISIILVFVCMIIGIISFICMLYPISRLYLPTRKRAFVVFICSFVLFFISVQLPPTMEEISIILVFVFMIISIISFICMLYPISRLYLPTRKRAFVVFICSFVLLFISVRLSPTYDPDMTYEEFKMNSRKNMVELDKTIQELKIEFKRFKKIIQEIVKNEL